jgi:hypothetical protein
VAVQEENIKYLAIFQDKQDVYYQNIKRIKRLPVWRIGVGGRQVNFGQGDSPKKGDILFFCITKSSNRSNSANSLITRLWNRRPMNINARDPFNSPSRLLF